MAVIALRSAMGSSMRRGDDMVVEGLLAIVVLLARLGVTHGNSGSYQWNIGLQLCHVVRQFQA